MSTLRSNLRRLLLPIGALLLLAAGCGGSTETAGSSSPAGASIVPATAPVFVAVDTDLSSDQVKQADELLQKFPGREKLLAELRRSLSHEGVDLEQVKSAVGPEVDIVVLDLGNSPNVVGMTQPKDEAAFDKLLETGSNPAVHTRVGDWTIFGDDQAALDAFTAAQSGEKLADKASFTEGMGKLPEQALAKAYVDGAGIDRVVREQLQGQVPGGFGGLDKLKWLVASLEAKSNGAGLRLVADGLQQGGSGDYSTELLDKAPEGALLFATFKSQDQALDQLTQGAGGALLEQALGVKLADLTALFEGETALWVSAGTPIPEVTVVLSGDPKRSLATLDTLAARLTALAGGGATRQTTVAGVTMTEVPLGVVSILYGEVDGKVLLTDVAGAVRDFQSGPNRSLADDPSYQDAVDAAGMPKENGGFVYVNVADAIATVSSLVSASQDAIPPDVEANLRPLRSFVLWSEQDGSTTDLQAFLEIR